MGHALRTSAATRWDDLALLPAYSSALSIRRHCSLEMGTPGFSISIALALDGQASVFSFTPLPEAKVAKISAASDVAMPSANDLRSMGVGVFAGEVERLLPCDA